MALEVRLASSITALFAEIFEFAQEADDPPSECWQTGYSDQRYDDDSQYTDMWDI